MSDQVMEPKPEYQTGRKKVWRDLEKRWAALYNPTYSNGALLRLAVRYMGTPQKEARGEDETDEKELTPLQKKLLQWPTLTDEELQEIEEKRKRLNEWK